MNGQWVEVIRGHEYRWQSDDAHWLQIALWLRYEWLENDNPVWTVEIGVPGSIHSKLFTRALTSIHRIDVEAAKTACLLAVKEEITRLATVWTTKSEQDADWQKTWKEESTDVDTSGRIEKAVAGEQRRGGRRG